MRIICTVFLLTFGIASNAQNGADLKLKIGLIYTDVGIEKVFGKKNSQSISTTFGYGLQFIVSNKFGNYTKSINDNSYYFDKANTIFGRVWDAFFFTAEYRNYFRKNVIDYSNNTTKFYFGARLKTTLPEFIGLSPGKNFGNKFLQTNQFSPIIGLKKAFDKTNSVGLDFQLGPACIFNYNLTQMDVSCVFNLSFFITLDQI